MLKKDRVVLRRCKGVTVVARTVLAKHIRNGVGRRMMVVKSFDAMLMFWMVFGRTLWSFEDEHERHGRSDHKDFLTSQSSFDRSCASPQTTGEQCDA